MGSATSPAARDDLSVVVARTYDAPAWVLYDAWRDPEQLKKWYGPRGWPLTRCEMDFRVGGSVRFVLTGPDGDGPPFGGQYLEIVPDRKIVYSNGFLDADEGQMTVTVTFEEAAGSTTVTVHTLFPNAAMKARHVNGGYAGGVLSGLEQLAELVTPSGGEPQS